MQFLGQNRVKSRVRWLTLFGGDARDDLSCFESPMLLNSEETAGRQECGSCPFYLDPVFHHSQNKYDDFVFDLYRRGSVEFNARVKTVNGLFFVAKKDGKLRMLSAARPTNGYYRMPSSSEHCSGSSFASLCVPADKCRFSAQHDVRFFYRLRFGKALAQ